MTILSMNKRSVNKNNKDNKSMKVFSSSQFNSLVTPPTPPSSTSSISSYASDDSSMQESPLVTPRSPPSPSPRTPLQLIFDMDETMLHFLPKTGTTMNSVQLSDVPFLPAIGLASKNATPPLPTSSPGRNFINTNRWLQSFQSSKNSNHANQGTNATFIYHSNPFGSAAPSGNDVTILLEDASGPLCEKRPLHTLNGITLIRPHIRTFLERLALNEKFDVTMRIWTAAPQSYADHALDAMGWGSSVRRFYQQHCSKFLLKRPLFAHRVANEANQSNSSSFEVNDLTVGDTLYLKPISSLFHLDGGDKWSPANTVLIDNAQYVGLRYGMKQILAPDFHAVAVHDRSLLSYWCHVLQSRFSTECTNALKSIGFTRLEDALKAGRLHIKRLIDDRWMAGEVGFQRIIQSVEAAMNQSNDASELDYFGTMMDGERIPDY